MSCYNDTIRALKDFEKVMNWLVRAQTAHDEMSTIDKGLGREHAWIRYSDEHRAKVVAELENAQDAYNRLGADAGWRGPR